MVCCPFRSSWYHSKLTANAFDVAGSRHVATVNIHLPDLAHKTLPADPRKALLARYADATVDLQTILPPHPFSSKSARHHVRPLSDLILEGPVRTLSPCLVNVYGYSLPFSSFVFSCPRSRSLIIPPVSTFTRMGKRSDLDLMCLLPSAPPALWTTCGHSGVCRSSRTSCRRTARLSGICLSALQRTVIGTRAESKRSNAVSWKCGAADSLSLAHGLTLPGRVLARNNFKPMSDSFPSLCCLADSSSPSCGKPHLASDSHRCSRPFTTQAFTSSTSPDLL